MESKTTAAAKLILQELDPAAKRKRREFTNGHAQGILSINVKTLQNFTKAFFFTTGMEGLPVIRVLLRITIQGISKSSKTVSISRDSRGKDATNQTKSWKRSVNNEASRARPTSGSAYQDSIGNEFIRIVLNEIKNFSLELSRQKENQRNFLRFDLVEIESMMPPSNQSRRPSLILGSATIHVYDLIKQMYGRKQVSILIRDKKLADVELEFVFRYGAFGYGYSHQLKQSDHPVSELLKESMFFKVNPVGERRNEEGFLIPSVLSKPDFIPFEKVPESDMATPHKPSSESFLEMHVDTTDARKLMENRNRLARMIREYLSLSTRFDRTKYLESLVAKIVVSSPTFEYSNDENDYDEQGLAKDGQGLLGEDAKTTVENLSPLLLMAPGMHQRNNRIGTISKRADYDIYGKSEEFDEGNEDSSNRYGSLMQSDSDEDIARRESSKLKGGVMTNIKRNLAIKWNKVIDSDKGPEISNNRTALNNTLSPSKMTLAEPSRDDDRKASISLHESFSYHSMQKASNFFLKLYSRVSSAHKRPSELKISIDETD